MIGGTYRNPNVRLPGAGGAPEIAASCREVIVVIRHGREKFVERLDFVSSIGFAGGPGGRRALGLLGGGPTSVITDLGVLEPDPETCELVLTHVHPGVTLAQVKSATGWDLRSSPTLAESAPPTDEEITILRNLEQTRAGSS